MAQARAVERQAETDATAASIYDLYAPSLRTRCLRLTRDPVAADDLMQEVFAQFLAKVPDPPAAMNVHGYLLAMARNIWLNQARAGRVLSFEEIDEQPVDDRLEHDPVRTLLLREQRQSVQQGAARLTTRQRQALTLRELDDRSYAEIGEELGLGSNAVAQVVWRARGQLRRTLRRSQVDVERMPESCRDLLDDLSDRADSAEREGSHELDLHIADCGVCRNTLASFQEVGSRLRGAVPLVPLAALIARAGTTLRACVETPAGIGTAVAVSAVVAAGGGGAAFVARHTGGSTPASAATVIAGGGRAGARGPAPSSRRVAVAARSLVVLHSTVHRPASTGTRVTGLVVRQPDPTRTSAPAKAPASRVPVTVTRPVIVRAETPVAPATPPVATHEEPPKQRPAEKAETDAPAGTPPGQAKKEKAATDDASLPPGQAKKQAPATGTDDASLPPGQAKKQAPAASADDASLPPGQATKQAAAQSPAADPAQVPATAAPDPAATAVPVAPPPDQPLVATPPDAPATAPSAADAAPGQDDGKHAGKGSQKKA